MQQVFAEIPNAFNRIKYNKCVRQITHKRARDSPYSWNVYVSVHYFQFNTQKEYKILLDKDIQELTSTKNVSIEHAKSLIRKVFVKPTGEFTVLQPIISYRYEKQDVFAGKFNASIHWGRFNRKPRRFSLYEKASYTIADLKSILKENKIRIPRVCKTYGDLWVLLLKQDYPFLATFPQPPAKECCICFEAGRYRKAFQCEHNEVCDACEKKLIKDRTKPTECPLCRSGWSA